MSQVLCGHPSFFDPALEHLVERIKASAQHGIVENFLGYNLGKAGARQPIIGAGTKQEHAITLSRHPIAMGPSDPLDQAMQTKAPKMVRHLTRSYVVGRLPQ